MPTLAWVDDDRRLRESYTTIIKSLLPKTWSILSEDPLPAASDYNSWIEKNDVAVLVLDERLDDQASKGRNPVTYKGHEVVEAVRRQRPEFPVFMITGFEQLLADRKGDIEDIITKQQIRNQADRSAYVKRIVRAGMRYYEARQKDINALSDLAMKTALGKASKRERAKLKALQTGLAIAAAPLPDEDRSDVLTELEKRLDKLDDLSRKLETTLARAPRRK